MKTKNILFLLLLSIILVALSFLPQTIAQDNTDNINITIKDAYTKEPITDVFLVINYEDIELNKFVGPGVFSVDLIPQANTVIKGDILNTFGKDYYLRTNTFSNILYLFPSATLSGMVKDNLDNVVGYADLKFECSNDVGYVFPEKTDKFGSFSVEYAPAGQCKIYAYYKNAVGMQEITLERGALVDTEIKLDKSIVSEEKPTIFNFTFLIIIFVLVFIIVLAVILKSSLKQYKRKQTKINVEADKSSNNVGKRAEDIIRTLNEKEKEIVEFIIENNNITVQSKIRHALKIPRTSLSRILASLEKKKIIECEKHGKAVKIKFTDWFLEK